MYADPTRTLLVVSGRPHPWALLRDRLDARMVRVAWHRPGDAPPGRCWALAGEGSAPALGPRWPLLAWWVGEGGGGPAGARRAESWRAACAEVERALGRATAGVRLAPTCGLLPEGGAPSAALPALETLLAAPGGVPVGPGDAADVRRARAAIRRHRLPLELVVAGGTALLRAREAHVRPA